jgi:predicted N-acyltransferase
VGQRLPGEGLLRPHRPDHGRPGGAGGGRARRADDRGRAQPARRRRPYGRNWGALEERPFLHFECCYYQAIDYAIAHGLARVEAGAQGVHKIQRGYLPVATHSAHWIADPGLRAGVAQFLAQERPAVRAEMTALAQHSPYRNAGEG